MRCESGTRMSKARMQTAAWWALGLALALWLAGDALWILAPERPRTRSPAAPTRSGSPATPPPAPASRCCCGRACAARSGPTMWLDGAIAAAAVAVARRRRGAGTRRGRARLPARRRPAAVPRRRRDRAARPPRRAHVRARRRRPRAVRRGRRRPAAGGHRGPRPAGRARARLRRRAAGRDPPAPAPVGGAHVGLPAAFTLAALGVLLWDRQVARAERPGDRPRAGRPVPARRCGSRSACARTPGCSSARATRR